MQTFFCPMREKVVGNAVCQVRTSQACCGLNPRDCQKENKAERVKPQLGMNTKTLADHSCLLFV